MEINFKITPYLDYFEWASLSCFERTLAMVGENIREKFGLYLLLLKYEGNDYFRRSMSLGIGDNGFYRYIAEKSGIDIKKEKILRRDFGDVLKQLTDNGDVFICATNNKYQKGSKHYMIKDHMHFLIIVGYDEEANKYIVYDEDETGEFWKSENYKDGIRYIIKYIESEELFELCTHMKGANIFFGDDLNKEDYGIIFYLKENGGTSEDPWDGFLRQIKYCCEHRDDIYIFIADRIAEYRADYKTRPLPGDIRNIDAAYRLNLNDPLGLKKRIFFPDECVLFENHYKELLTIRRFMEIVVVQNETVKETIAQLRYIECGYTSIKNTIAKAVLMLQDVCIDQALDIFEKLYNSEIEVFEYILENSDKYQIGEIKQCFVRI